MNTNNFLEMVRLSRPDTKRMKEMTKDIMNKCQEIDMMNAEQELEFRKLIETLLEERRAIYNTAHSEKLTDNERLAEITKILEREIPINTFAGEDGICTCMSEGCGGRTMKYSPEQVVFFRNVLRESLGYIRDAVLKHYGGALTNSNSYEIVKTNECTYEFEKQLDGDCHVDNLCGEYQKMLDNIEKVNKCCINGIYPYETFAKCGCVDGETFQNEADRQHLYGVQEALELTDMCREIVD